MATKKHKAPPGLDYAPISGETENLSFGVIQAAGGDGETNTAEGAIFRRLYPILRPDDPALPLDPAYLLPPRCYPARWRQRRALESAAPCARL